MTSITDRPRSAEARTTCGNRRGERARPLALRSDLAFIWAICQMTGVFAARITETGGIDVRDARWHGWQKYPVGLNGLYRPGDGVAAVCGVGFDVLEVDPRNGGLESWDALLALYGDEPDYFARLGSPSDGFHHYIATLGIGSHNNILPGLDLKGGLDDGSGRGFVFTPPTMRPRKSLDASGNTVYGPLRPYEWDGEMGTPGARDTHLASVLRELVAAADPSLSRPAGVGRSNGRQRLDLDVYREICLNARSGGQRTSLLLFVREMTLRGYKPALMLKECRELVADMPCYDKRRPWTDREIAHLFYRQGAPKIVPDASDTEMNWT